MLPVSIRSNFGRRSRSASPRTPPAARERKQKPEHGPRQDREDGEADEVHVATAGIAGRPTARIEAESRQNEEEGDDRGDDGTDQGPSNDRQWRGLMWEWPAGRFHLKPGRLERCSDLADRSARAHGDEISRNLDHGLAIEVANRRFDGRCGVTIDKAVKCEGHHYVGVGAHGTAGLRGFAETVSQAATQRQAKAREPGAKCKQY